MDLDKETVEKSTIDIDLLDPIGSDDLITIKDQTEGTYDNTEATISSTTLKTGNIIEKIFQLIAQIKEKSYWNLNKNEVNSLNDTCPKIIPKSISKHAGIITCVLSLISIIAKRIKLEQKEKENIIDSDIYPSYTNDKIIESTSLIGSRND